MADKIDISPEAVEWLAKDHDTVADRHDEFVMGHPHHWKTAATLRALSARLAEVEAALATARRDALEEAAQKVAVKDRRGKPLSGPHHAGIRDGRSEAARLIRALIDKEPT